MNKYIFNVDTPPKEIINSVILTLTENLKDNGFKYLKSKDKIIKRSKNFIYSFRIQRNRHNLRGHCAEIIIHCSIEDSKSKVSFWHKTLASTHSKAEQHKWINFYGKDNFERNISNTLSLINLKLIPYFNRMENDLENLVSEIAENGFCIFDEKQVYDAGYHIPYAFLEKYGNEEQLKIAFQNYIDRHELSFVKTNFKNALTLLKENKDVINNGEKEYAEIVHKKGIELKF